MNYQYHAFGACRAGLQARFDRDLVIALCIDAGFALPHSSGLAEHRGAQAYQMIGRYGFYEALDFRTPRT